MNKAIITKTNDITFLWIFEDEQVVECHPLTRNNGIKIGDIFIGRVEKVVKNIQSAFIRLDEENVGYLPLDDKPCMVLNRNLPKGLPSIAENDYVLVQVTGEPQKMKQAKVTGNISLGGNYIAIDFNKGHNGISKKINDKARCEALKQLIPKDTEYGYVFRTACEESEDQLIISEYHMLVREMEAIIQKATYEKKTGCIYSGKESYIDLLDGYGWNRFDEMITDIPEIYHNISNYHPSNLILYENDYSLSKLYGLETMLERLLTKKVWLKSGGFLIIEPTEAMVVIDVNTGKSIGKIDREKHVLKINMEAAVEIARQIRLRNLSGIIMVDFINMESDETKNTLIALIKKELRKDKIPSHFVDITKLELYEITRKKVRKPIYEVIKSDK
ncbi:MAG: ribonuclease E/G [Lachnospiraceae bacterium]